jgi:alpha-N-arabinofuranosidase
MRAAMTRSGSRGVTRRRFLANAGVVAAGPLALSASRNSYAGSGPFSASLVVEPEPLHALPRTQYGHFIEHLGMCVNGGIWAEGESDDMFLGGVRPGLLDAIRSINPPLIRYPGGCFADGYHWQDGIGPRDSRPVRENLAWGGQEDNRFGPDEFMALCREVGAEPMITVNVGSGTAEEAAAWVEYTNGPKDSRWGSERARNGSPEPYRVKYWFVGNEIFGYWEIGHQKPRQYVKTFREYARAMKRADPDIKLIAVGTCYPEQLISMGIKDVDNRRLLDKIGDLADYLSIHQYARPLMLRSLFHAGDATLHESDRKSVYYDVLGCVRSMESFVKKCIRDLERSSAGPDVRLCFDEWNLGYDFKQSPHNYNLRDGLWVATMFNMFHRHAREMPIANIAQMVNLLGVIVSGKRGSFLTPSGLAFKLYTDHAGDELLPSSVACPHINLKPGLPSLDVSATRDGDRLAMFIVNRHYDAEAMVQCRIKGRVIEPLCNVRVIHHPNPVQYNTFDEPMAVSISDSTARLQIEEDRAGSSFTIRLKPHSLTCVELKIRKA